MVVCVCVCVCVAKQSTAAGHHAPISLQELRNIFWWGRASESTPTTSHHACPTSKAPLLTALRDGAHFHYLIT